VPSVRCGIVQHNAQPELHAVCCWDVRHFVGRIRRRRALRTVSRWHLLCGHGSFEHHGVRGMPVEHVFRSVGSHQSRCMLALCPRVHHHGRGEDRVRRKACDAGADTANRCGSPFSARQQLWRRLQQVQDDIWAALRQRRVQLGLELQLRWQLQSQPRPCFPCTRLHAVVLWNLVLLQRVQLDGILCRHELHLKFRLQGRLDMAQAAGEVHSW
jgi:hypothetical protein